MTADKLRQMLDSVVRMREALRGQWVSAMAFDDSPISPELERCRADIIADAEWAETAELRIRRALVELRAGESMDAALVDLIARYRLPGWN